MKNMNDYKKRLTFIHISESLAAGVLKSVIQVANAQADNSHIVKVQYLGRGNTPPIEKLQQSAPKVLFECIDKSSAIGMAKLLFRLFSSDEYRRQDVVVHAHSSWAGILARITSIFRPINNLFYTPHCFAFLRTDVGKLRKKIFYFSESIISRVSSSTIIACGISEGELAIQIGCRNVNLGRNFVEIPDRTIRRTSGNTLNIGNVGRISRQKNPERFSQVASQFPHHWKAFWYGDGKNNLKKFLEDSGVKISGWISLEDSKDVYQNLDYFLLTSDWEGTPFSLLEAMANGVIPITWSYLGADSIIENGSNGFIFQSIDQVTSIISYLESDKDLKEDISNSAQKYVVDNHNLSKIGSIWPTFYNLSPKEMS
jgi:glycosyltransferase involved in cell wall biosynthesis